MKKITVKHYINNRLKSPSLYVRVIYDRKDTTFPSEIASKINPSEQEFLTDATLKREMEYETEIITSIIQFSVLYYKEKFSFSQINFSSLIHKWKYSIADEFFHIYIEDKSVRDDIRKPILDYLSLKSGVSVDIIDSIVAFHLDELEALLDLATNHKIYNSDITNTLIFSKLLYKYENLHYFKSEPIGKWIYGADNMLGYYEWQVKCEKTSFREYAKKQNLIPADFIDNKIEEFDKDLQSNIEAALYSSNFTDTQRKIR